MNTNRSKSRKMREVEARLGRPLEKALPELVTADKQTVVAERLGLSTATLNHWLLQLGIKVHHIALGPGDSITIKRAKS